MFLNYFGNLAWWLNFFSVNGEVKLFFNHSFQKQTQLSQTNIIGPNNLMMLSIPTVKESRRGLLKDVKIANQDAWQRTHWRAIEGAYRAAPFYIYYDYLLHNVYNQRFENLLDFNLALFEWCVQTLKLKTIITYDFETPQAYSEVKSINAAPYPQVFDNKYGFVSDMCILDLIFNLGPEAADYLTKNCLIEFAKLP